MAEETFLQEDRDSRDIECESDLSDLPAMTGSEHMDISVLIPTYNRSEILRETLEAMARADREGMSVEFVVIDNNSTDETREVTESFAGRLPVRYLFQGRPGKSSALNLALDSPGLGSIVVFTDDDVTPCEGWLSAIKATCDRWPNHSVFGGKIEVGWPDVDLPPWARALGTRTWIYGAYDPGQVEGTYPAAGVPVGGNCWVRLEVVREGRRFNEAVGPRGTDCIMGEDTEFLSRLAEDGYEIVYSPDAAVSHRIRPDQLTVDFVRRRAALKGIGSAHANAARHRDAWRRHPIIWRLKRLLSLTKWRFLYVVAMLSLSGDKRVVRSIDPIRLISGNLEAMRIVREAAKPRPT